MDGGIIERLVLIEVISFDWNCPKYITPRYTEDEVRVAVAPLQARIAELERTLAQVARQSPACTTLLSIPGVGLLTATAMAVAEWLGPKEVNPW